MVLLLVLLLLLALVLAQLVQLLLLQLLLRLLLSLLLQLLPLLQLLRLRAGRTFETAQSCSRRWRPCELAGGNRSGGECCSGPSGRALEFAELQLRSRRSTVEW